MSLVRTFRAPILAAVAFMPLPAHAAGAAALADPSGLPLLGLGVAGLLLGRRIARKRSGE